MLERTFLHCQGVGPRTECRLWSAGYAGWSDAVARPHAMPLSAALRSAVRDLSAESLDRLSARDALWFAQRLPAAEHWRAAGAFADRTAFLDIETTGGGPGACTTVVGVLYGGELHQFVRHENLRGFRDLLEEAALVVTFFGTGFDLPVLREEFRWQPPPLHLDLCPALRRLGLRGGLKSIEQQVGIARPGETAGLSGWDAVRLWWRWENAEDATARDRLLAYNADDVRNLRLLLEMALPRLERAAAGAPDPAAGAASTDRPEPLLGRAPERGPA
ncbi:MAG TPA: ribonuclease H-like domain-containing protein [Chthonomonadales bacterium]|nr:ribonuclease H-like domain-containing protein [Chthonomonadales bacterium]